MGYATTYRLNWAARNKQAFRACEHTVPDKAKFCPECGAAVSNVSIDDVISAWILARKKNSPDFMYGVDEFGSTSESCKWYDHETEVKELSRRFPTVLFTLEGEGEESGDIWKRYFLNGKVQYVKAKLVFDPFDESKLK